jgi:hypothetical protein
MKTAFIYCTVRPGMFDNEYVVAVNQSAALVSSGNVQVHNPVTLQGTEGAVRVYVVEESANDALVELPGESVLGGLRTMVPKTSFVYAA